MKISIPSLSTKENVVDFTGREVGIIARTLRAVPLAAVTLALAMVAQTDAAVIWNADTSKTAAVYSLDNGNTATVSKDPIDIGQNIAYTVIPYFLFQLSGYSSGSQIASVDSLSLNINLTKPAAQPNFSPTLYIWTGTSLAETGNVTTSDFRYPNDNQYQLIALQTSVFTPSTSTGVQTISVGSTGRDTLLSYLQSNYVNNNYLALTLRTSPPTDPNFSAYDGLYRLNEANTITGSVVTTAIPEPSTAVCIVLGGLGLLALRRMSNPRRATQIAR